MMIICKVGDLKRSMVSYLTTRSYSCIKILKFMKLPKKVQQYDNNRQINLYSNNLELAIREKKLNLKLNSNLNLTYFLLLHC